MKTVLIVDDNQDFINLTTDYLRQKGHHALGASSCAEALEILQTEKPGLILIDLLMPKTDGFETYEILKKHTASGTHVVMISGANDPNMIDRAYLVGMEDYVVKAKDIKTLYARIEKYLI